MPYGVVEAVAVVTVAVAEEPDVSVFICNCGGDDKECTMFYNLRKERKSPSLVHKGE